MTDTPSRIRDANENLDMKAYNGWRIAVGATDIFANIGGAAMPADTVCILMKPEDRDEDLRFKFGGDASATTMKIPEDGIYLPVDKATADAMEVFFNGATSMTLIAFIPRT